MRIALISDIHANLEALEATVRDISGQAVDRIVCLGDIVGYNANPAECIALLRELDADCVGGNHDRAVAEQITTAGFSVRAARAVVWTRERLVADAIEFLAGLPLQVSVGNHLTAVHGTLGPHGGCEKTYLNTDERRQRCFEALIHHPSRIRICAYGHTHRLAIFELRAGLVRALDGDDFSLCEDSYYLINPGTVGEPHNVNDRRATYLILDTPQLRVSVRRIEYDSSVPALKTWRAGLAPRPSLSTTAIRSAVKWSTRRLGIYNFISRFRGGISGRL